MEAVQRKWIFLMLFLCLVIEIRCQYGTKSYDICSKNPCYHKGRCVQTSIHPGYKCRCLATGYYGDRCQLPCPTTTGKGEGKTAKTPYECIVI